MNENTNCPGDSHYWNGSACYGGWLYNLSRGTRKACVFKCLTYVLPRMLRILPLRCHLYKAPSDQMKFKNKGLCFQSQIVSYKKSHQGNLFQKLAKRNSIKEYQHRIVGRRREGEVKGSLAGSLWLAVLVRVLPLIPWLGEGLWWLVLPLT